MMAGYLVTVVYLRSWQVEYLIVVSVAEGTTERVHGIADSDIRSEAIGAQLRAQCNGGARIRLVGTSADGCASRWVGVLPDSERVVDE